MPGAAKYPDGQEGFSPQAAFDGREPPSKSLTPLSRLASMSSDFNMHTPHKFNGNWQEATVSIVGSAADTATRDITVGEALNRIRDGCWKNLTSRVKDKYDKAYNTAREDGRPDPAKAAKKAVDSLKRKLPAITFSGQFERRHDCRVARPFRALVCRH